MKKREGMSLIESAIVFAVIGLVIGGIWLAAAKVSNSLKINSQIEQIIRLTDVIRRTHQGFIPGTSFSFNPRTSFLINAGYVPSHFICGAGSNICNAWGQNGRMSINVGLWNATYGNIIFVNVGVPTKGDADTIMGRMLAGQTGGDLIMASCTNNVDPSVGYYTPLVGLVNCPVAASGTVWMSFFFTQIR